MTRAFDNVTKNAGAVQARRDPADEWEAESMLELPGVAVPQPDRPHALNLTTVFERWLIGGPPAGPYWGQGARGHDARDAGQMNWPPDAVKMAFDEPPGDDNDV